METGIKNLNELEPAVCSALENLGYPEVTIKMTIGIVRTVIRLHCEQGKQQLDREITDDYFRQQAERYKNGEIGYAMSGVYKRAQSHLVQISSTGTIVYKRLSNRPRLPNEFECVLSELLQNKEWSLKTRKRQHDFSRSFFCWLNDRGYFALSDIHERIVREYLTESSKRMSGGGFYSVRMHLQRLLLFISEDGVLSESMNKMFLLHIPIEKKIKAFMPQEDIATILNAIDRTTAKGKRDYAIILLAATSGMRGIDIAMLTLESIDWRNGEIRIIQEKTGSALALPLTADVGKAVSDYITSARPHENPGQIFLSNRAPFNPLTARAFGAFLKCYCVKLGLPEWSFHAIRRSIATNMVTSGVSVITVAQVLGHRSINSTKQYISLDSSNLKKCALDFTGIQPGGVL